MKINFSKMHGLGNDYVVIDAIHQRINLTPAIIKNLCSRNFGVGADGVVAVLPVGKSSDADLKMRIFNADGSEAEMCGNGIRCLAKFAYEHKLTKKKSFMVETLAGIKPITLHLIQNRVKSVKVEMGIPKGINNFEIRITNLLFPATNVSMGNPHCVIFVKDTDQFPVEKYGPLIEHDNRFVQGTNVEFVQLINKNTLKQRTWERGVGETFACGTGASASAVAGVFNKMTNRNVTVILKGGKLDIEYTTSGMVYLEGVAEEVFTGTIL
jgi:diaminopimelate epimerase